jgi:hypothetical protein
MRKTLSITVAGLILLLFALAPALAQEGPDEVESNDTMSLADSIDGYTIEGEIGRHGDEDDWFRLEGQEGYHPIITLYYDDDECDIDLEVYSGEDFVGSLTSTTSPDSDQFDVPDDCYIHVYIYDGHGDYTVEIEPGDRDRDRDRDRDHRRDCEGPDEIESNDVRRDADLIEGFEIEGYACEDDDDWFVLNGQEGYHPYITVYYDDYDCDIDVEVYSDRDLVGTLNSVDSPDGDEFEVMDVCYLHVWAFEGEGDYTIEIEPQEGGSGGHGDECEGPDEWESNDTMDLADSIDTLDFEGYACEGDSDWFRLEGQQGRRPQITLYYDDSECDIDLEVYSDDEYVGSLTSTSSPDEDEFRVPDTCYIHVYSYDGEGWYEVEIEP